MWVSDIKTFCRTLLTKENALSIADDDSMFVFDKLSDLLDWRNDLFDSDMKAYANMVRNIKEDCSDYWAYRLE